MDSLSLMAFTVANLEDAEILSVGKIAESSRFAERKRLKSHDRISLIRAAASYRLSSS